MLSILESKATACATFDGVFYTVNSMEHLLKCVTSTKKSNTAILSTLIRNRRICFCQVIVVCAGAEDAVAAANQLINEFRSVPSCGDGTTISDSASGFGSCVDFAQLYRELWQRDEFRVRAVAVAEVLADELIALIDCIAQKQPAASLIFWVCFHYPSTNLL